MSSSLPKLTFYVANKTEAKKIHQDLLKEYDDVGLDNADILVAIGGDGTMLECLHMVRDKDLSVYGINCGSVGFLLNPYRPQEFKKHIQNTHHVTIYPLIMNATDVHGKDYEVTAFNEVSLLRQTRQAAKLKISIDGIERISELVCDGTLLSTPAGSTAYNLSAHGPIIPLSGNVLALTPISAFRPRRWRGALLPCQSAITIDVMNPDKRPVSATADSKEIRDIKTLQIKQSNKYRCTLLFDLDQHLEERILREQFEV